jgi:hypothetical protein
MKSRQPPPPPETRPAMTPLPGRSLVSPASFQGTWSGNVQANGTSANAALNLTQSGNQVSGTLTTPSGTANISGKVVGNTLTFAIDPGSTVQLPCAGLATGTATRDRNNLTVAFNAQPTDTTNGGLVARNTLVSVGGAAVEVSTGTVCPAGLTAQGTFTQITSNASIGLRLGL